MINITRLYSKLYKSDVKKGSMIDLLPDYEREEQIEKAWRNVNQKKTIKDGRAK